MSKINKRLHCILVLYLKIKFWLPFVTEHDLMLEIDKLKRTNAMQKTQLAELEARLIDSERQTEKDSGRSASAKPNAGTARLFLYCSFPCL